MDPSSEEKNTNKASDHESDEDEVSDRKHSSLINTIGSLDGRKRKVNERSEPSAQVSEFHVGGSTESRKIKLHELVGTFKNTARHSALKKQLNSVRKSGKILSTPLSKPEQERVQRSIAYDITSKEISKWEPIVQQNRKAEQLKFPLNQPDLKLPTSDQIIQRFQPRTPLELEVAKLLHGSQHVFTKDKPLSKAEEKALKAMSLEEATRRRAELQKFRALLSYKEAKQRRQNKIKSKTYHRILRKEKLKNTKRDLLEMEGKDPEAFAEKLNQVEKERVEERISLKHKGGSQKMKKVMAFGKYNDQARQSLQDMLTKNKELTEKRKAESSASEEEDEDDDDKTMDVSMATSGQSLGGKQTYNPWMTHGAPKSADSAKLVPLNNSDEDLANDNTRGCYRKPEAVQNCEVASDSSDGEDREDSHTVIIKKSDSRQKRLQLDRNEEQEDSEEEIISQSLERKKTYEEFEDFETIDTDSIAKVKVRKVGKPSKMVEENDKRNKDVYIDPKKVLTVEAEIIASQNSQLVTEDNDDVDNVNDADREQRMTIAQAFAEDDVIEEFTQEKKSIREKDKLKDIDLTLPGWGEWGGVGIQPSKKKRKRFMIKAPPPLPRKDKLLGNVIISETKDNSIAKHQVNQLPFPFTNVKQFQSSIRAPIGKTWNTEMSFRELVKPKVTTQLGKIISPIDKNSMFKKQKVTGKAFIESKRTERDSHNKKKASDHQKGKRKV